MMKPEEKRRRLARGLSMSVLALALAGTVSAAEERAAPPAGEAAKGATGASRSAPQGAFGDLRASKLIGMAVENAQGESLGEIKDLVVDVNNERVHYAVLGFGGTLGMGEKLFAYPVGLFGPAAQRERLVLNVDREKLKGAPGFEKSRWPEWGRDRYGSDVNRYFGAASTVKPMPNERLVRASELIGKNVDDREGKKAGEIQDLVVNLETAKVHYAVFDFSKSWLTADKLLPMSLKSLTFPADRKKDPTLNVAKSEIDLSQGFEKRRWPDLNDPAYQKRVDAYLRSGGPLGAAGPAGSARTGESKGKASE